MWHALASDEATAGQTTNIGQATAPLSSLQGAGVHGGVGHGRPQTLEAVTPEPRERTHGVGTGVGVFVGAGVGVGSGGGVGHGGPLGSIVHVIVMVATTSPVAVFVAVITNVCLPGARLAKLIPVAQLNSAPPSREH